MIEEDGGFKWRYEIFILIFGIGLMIFVILIFELNELGGVNVK